MENSSVFIIRKISVRIFWQVASKFCQLKNVRKRNHKRCFNLSFPENIYLYFSLSSYFAANDGVKNNNSFTMVLYWKLHF